MAWGLEDPQFGGNIGAQAAAGRPMNPQPVQQQAAPRPQQVNRSIDANRLISMLAGQARQQQQSAGTLFGGQGGAWGYMPQQQSPYVQAAGVTGRAGVDRANIAATSQDYGVDVGAETAIQLSQMSNEAKWAQMNRLAQMLNTGAQAYGPGETTPFAGYS